MSFIDIIFCAAVWLAADIILITPFALAAWRRSHERARYQKFLAKLLEV